MVTPCNLSVGVCGIHRKLRKLPHNINNKVQRSKFNYCTTCAILINTQGYNAGHSDNMLHNNSTYSFALLCTYIMIILHKIIQCILSTETYASIRRYLYTHPCKPIRGIRDSYLTWGTVSHRLFKVAPTKEKGGYRRKSKS